MNSSREEFQREQGAVRARERTITMPHFVVPPECAATCRHLRKVADEAILKSVAMHNSQIVVVCAKHRRFGCTARMIYEGSWVEGWGDSDVPTFLVSPGAGPGWGPVSHEIAKALEAGAVDYDVLPSL